MIRPLATMFWSVALVATLTAGGPAFRGRPPAIQATKHDHLYVLGGIGMQPAIFRYPLNADGLPAALADGLTMLGGTWCYQRCASGFAVDRDGRMHVSVVDGGVVETFNFDQSRPQFPVGTLNTGGSPDFLRFDEAGRLYVHDADKRSISVYAPGAQGNAKPISVVGPWHANELITDFAVAPSGPLFVLDFAGDVIIYDDPLHGTTQPNAFLGAQGGYEFQFQYTLALDAKAKRLYVQFTPQCLPGCGSSKLNYAARDLGGGQPDGWLRSNRCYSASDSWVSSSLVADKYLLVDCSLGGVVYAFRTDRFGKRQPVETIGLGTNAWLMARGP
jgi:hypothetical protein